MQCRHGKKIDSKSWSTACESCNQQLNNHRRKLQRLFDDRNPKMEDFFIRLLEEAESVAVYKANGQKITIPGVKKISEKISGEEKGFLSILVEFDPIIVRWDQANDIVFVLNLFTKKQKWSIFNSQWSLTKPEKQKRKKSNRNHEVEPIPVEQIKESTLGQTRQKCSPGFSEDSLRELGESIKAEGQLVPAIVRKLSKDKINGGKKFELLAGERRWRACKQAGLTTLNCIVYPENLSDDQAITITVLENANREDLTLMEVARAAYRLKEEFNWTLEKIGKKMGKTAGRLSQLMPLNELPERVQELMIREPRRLSVVQALKLLEYRNKEDQITAAESWIDQQKKKIPTAQGSKMESSGKTKTKRAAKGNILDTCPNAPVKDGCSVEENKFHNRMNTAPRQCADLAALLAEASARRIYMKSWIEDNPGSAHRIRELLEKIETRAGQVREILEENL